MNDIPSDSADACSLGADCRECGSLTRAAACLTALGVAIGMVSAPAVAGATLCQGTAVTIVGTPASDTIRGTRGDDVIAGLGGDDRIQGLRGSDKICGGRGRDVLLAGRGFDQLRGDHGGDRLRGGRGSDSFWPPDDSGRDRFDGGHGNDFLFFNKADDRVVIDLRRGYFRIGERRETISSGSFETIYGSRWPDRILGDAEHNVLFAGFDSFGDTLRGFRGNDYLEGYEASDAMMGGAGDDVFSGVTGKDEVDGGPGQDLIRLCGHFSGSDACGSGSMTAETGATVDLAAGTLSGAGDATLRNIESVEATAGADSIAGSDNGNDLYGGPGDDAISGRGGNDNVMGDGFAPLPRPLSKRLREGDLSGPDGSDSLDGGEGADSIDGGGGDDTCINGESVVNCEEGGLPSYLAWLVRYESGAAFDKGCTSSNERGRRSRFESFPATR